MTFAINKDHVVEKILQDPYFANIAIVCFFTVELITALSPYFVIKKGLSGGFFRGLEELKYFVETGEFHERKLVAPHCG